MAKFDFDIIVIGTGAGGSVAAHIAASAGKKVAVVESTSFGGESPNWSCVPMQSLLHAAEIYNQAKQANRFGIRSAAMSYNYPTIKSWKDLAVRRTGVGQGKTGFESEGIHVIKGEARFTSPHEITVGRRQFSANNFIIATGSTSFIPKIEGLNKVKFLTFREAVNLTRPPKSIFIIGGGSTGTEFANLFSIFGSRVFIADIASRLLPKEDEEIGNLIKENLEKERRAHVLTSSKVIKVEKEGLAKRVHYQQGSDIKSIKVDEILLATGKTPATDLGLENAGIDYSSKGIAVNDQLQTTAKNIFAAGDVVGPYHYTHMAIYQSRVAAHNILHRQKTNANYQAVPRVVFTVPQVAAVGITEEEAMKYAIKFKTAITPISIVGRSNVTDTHDGFVKIIVDKNSLKIIGASIAAPAAAEMIHELTLAIQNGLTAQDVANTIHAYPTWSEATRISCNKLLH